MVCKIATRGLYYKILRIRNVRQIERFHRKQVSSIAGHKHTSFDKHISLLRTLYIMLLQGFYSAGPRCKCYETFFSSSLLVE